MKEFRVFAVDDSSVMRKTVEGSICQASLYLGEVLQAGQGAPALLEALWVGLL